MTFMPNASLLEWCWTLMSLPGLGLSLYNVNGAVHDLRYHWRDELRTVGVIGLVKVGAVLVMATLVLVSGLAAMLAPEPVRPQLQDAGDLVAVCLVGLDVLTLGLAFAFFLERRYIVPHVRERRGAT